MSANLPNHAAPKIRVLLVEDSPMSAEIIRRMLASAPEIDVVGAARNGLEALEMIPRLRPDLVCTDLHMPKMDGLALTREIMARHPLPILVLSVSVQADQTQNIFKMLEAGALDVMAKPRAGLEADFGVAAHDLIRKIRILSGVKVFRRMRPAPAADALALAPVQRMAAPPGIVGIGASTGGPQALEAILGALPRGFGLPLLCVQHISQGFTQGLVEWLAGRCRIAVRTAEEGEGPHAGTAYFPPDGRHLEVDAAGGFRCSAALPVGGLRPSIDITLSSLARSYGSSAVGVLLTGMGQDGAQGLLDIARAGGVTIAQDEATSAVFGMPRRAVELGAAARVLPLELIAPALRGLAERERAPEAP